MKKCCFDNRKRPRRTGSRAGSALITVLGIALILMMAGATMVVLSRQSIFRIQRTSNYVQAQAVAESGIADMMAKLGTNFTYWKSNTYTATFFSNGAYHVWTTPITNGHVLIISDGIYKGESNRTILEVQCTEQDRNNARFGTNSAILADGVVTLDSGAYDIYGDVHANNNVNLANGDIIGGIVTAAGVVNPTSGGASHQTERAMPEFNFDSYRQMAINGGTYREGNQTMSGRPIASPANGVLYVNGNLSIANQSSFTGTIVVNGNIVTANKFDQYAYSGHTNWPSLLSTGSINLNNHETYNGVVFAQTTININNKITILGGVISGGIVYIRNGVDIHHNSTGGYPAWDPLNPEVPPVVIVGGWLK